MGAVLQEDEYLLHQYSTLAASLGNASRSFESTAALPGRQHMSYMHTSYMHIEASQLGDFPHFENLASQLANKLYKAVLADQATHQTSQPQDPFLELFLSCCFYP